MSKVILITGASSGIGKATAGLLAREGYTVYAGARRMALMEELRELGVVPLKLDLAQEKSLAETVDHIVRNEGRIDVLINNAGFGLFGPVEDIPINEARYQFEVNLFGLAYLTQLILPHMRNQKSGRIINISSVGGKLFTPLGAWYHASKHALEGWSDCLRIETRPFGIQVVVIEPGAIDTGFTEPMQAYLEKYDAGTAYKKQTSAYLEKMKNRNHGLRKLLTDPEVLGKEVLKAIKARHPRRRYVKGFMGKPMLFIRKYFGDAVYEWLLRKGFN